MKTYHAAADELALATLIIDLEFDPSGKVEGELFNVLFRITGNSASCNLAIIVHWIRVVIFGVVFIPVFLIVVGDEGTSLTA